MIVREAKVKISHKVQSLSFSLCVYAHGSFQVEGKDGIQFESLKRSHSAQTTLLSSL